MSFLYCSRLRRTLTRSASEVAKSLSCLRFGLVWIGKISIADSIKTVVFAVMLASTHLAIASSHIPTIPFEKYTLPNGLQVILHEDHSTPIVTVNVWYHVGAKNELPGKTGFAHLFEHMMFQGSKHQNDFFGPLQQAGGRLNGSTTQDRTNPAYPVACQTA